mmetsp:Transcript_5762/g.13285  ORF Transcript_5762/g.13285 Transcript_5762/m.13285 type:complete len:125 (+) Transcript_5762:273-647(+)
MATPKADHELVLAITVPPTSLRDWCFSAVSSNLDEKAAASTKLEPAIWSLAVMQPQPPPQSTKMPCFSKLLPRGRPLKFQSSLSRRRAARASVRGAAQAAWRPPPRDARSGDPSAKAETGNCCE